jgi:hypothetical protein
VAEPKVVITDMMEDELAPEREVLGGGHRLEALCAPREEELAGRVEDADAVIVYQLPVSRPTTERLERCRVIVRGGVGYDEVDRVFARERGIPVANVPDYCTEEVADSALRLMLALTRGLASLNARLRAREVPWSYAEAAPLRRLRGRVLGIVGLGRIGTATAPPGEGAGDGGGVLRPLQAPRLRQGARAAPGGDARGAGPRLLGAEPALPADAGDPADDRRAHAVAAAAGGVPRQHRPGRHRGHVGRPRRPRQRPAGRGRARRPGGRAPRGGRSPDPRLARPAAPGSLARRSHAPLRLLLREVGSKSDEGRPHLRAPRATDPDVVN